MSRELFLAEGQIHEMVEQFGTPFHLYDEAGMRATAGQLNATFDWVEPQDGVGYVNHFAVKAAPNPHILEVLADEGMGADASSGPEVEISQAVGLERPYLMFTSNNTPPEEYREADEAGAIINLDDLNQLDILIEALGGRVPDTLSFRYNPGNKRATGVNNIIGVPEDAKFGTPDEQFEEGYRRAKELGVEHFGIHTMIVSNELGAPQHVATATMLFEKVVELSEKLGIAFEFANLGGGLGIPYRPEQQPVDYAELRDGIEQAYKEIILGNNLPPLRVITENGRHITGPHGILVATVRSIKETFHRYVGLDATTISDLARPAMYDAYHDITVLGKRLSDRAVQRVVGSLCENNDYFTGAETKDRLLPVMEEGDIVVIHDAGAHGHAMGSNYNGKLRSGEYLLQPDGSVRQIRKPETRAELFSTLDYPGLDNVKHRYRH